MAIVLKIMILCTVRYYLVDKREGRVGCFETYICTWFFRSGLVSGE